ncbi:MAG: hypothetical protein IJ228_12270 [Succinivibrio sp.]|nr:hypothetical protein [Succinivibrio sp.]
MQGLYGLAKFLAAITVLPGIVWLIARACSKGEAPQPQMANKNSGDPNVKLELNRPLPDENAKPSGAFKSDLTKFAADNDIVLDLKYDSLTTIEMNSALTMNDYAKDIKAQGLTKKLCAKVTENFNQICKDPDLNQCINETFRQFINKFGQKGVHELAAKITGGKYDKKADLNQLLLGCLIMTPKVAFGLIKEFPVDGRTLEENIKLFSDHLDALVGYYGIGGEASQPQIADKNKGAPNAKLELNRPLPDEKAKPSGAFKSDLTKFAADNDIVLDFKYDSLTTIEMNSALTMNDYTNDLKAQGLTKKLCAKVMENFKQICKDPDLEQCVTETFRQFINKFGQKGVHELAAKITGGKYDKKADLNQLLFGCLIMTPKVAFALIKEFPADGRTLEENVKLFSDHLDALVSHYGIGGYKAPAA